MTTLQHTLLTTLAAKNAGDSVHVAMLLDRVEASLGLLLDQLEAHEGSADEIDEIAAAVERFYPRYDAEEIVAGMQLAMQRN
ncbi:MAG: hypothetical protein GY747_03840 [Planctomycetes bacterium]|nr:hypothetical protein [Planctomycetota bacterium]MCP4770935.1 hypothetical protein [Planctomycetota bacterium]MCP4861655.1 hypothetical protein [Planctomycetota bacterium]